MFSTTDDKIIKESLKRELALLEAKIGLVKREIEEFERKYSMNSDEFLKKFESGELGDEQDFFEWWGLLKGLKKLEENIKKIKALLSFVGMCPHY